MFNIDKLHNIPPKKFDKAKLQDVRDKNFDRYAEQSIVKGLRSCGNKFETGDKVKIFRQQKGSKIGSHWSEGYVITERVGEDSFFVAKNGNIIRASKKHIRRSD